MTDLHGFSLRLSWSNFGTAVNVDTTAGRPGNSVVSYHLVGQLSVTNTTPGKQAPRPQDNVNIQPLWLNDSGQFCSLVAEAVSYNPYWDGVSECDNGGNYTINGKKYIGLDFMSWRIGMQDSDMLGVGETKTYVDSRDGYYGNTWSVEIPADKAQPLAGVLRSPDIVIVTDGTSSSAGVYVNCISDLESGVCLLGGSDW